MENFRNKHFLFDTNVLILFSKYLTEKNNNPVKSFVSNLTELNIKPVAEESTLFEFKRGSKEKKFLESKEAFLDLFLGDDKFIIPTICVDLFKRNSLMLALLYSHYGINLAKQISFIDCLIGGVLMQFKDNMLLVTSDHNDYPLFIFDRLKLVTFDLGKEIVTIGIYAFNQDKYQKRLNLYNKTL